MKQASGRSFAHAFTKHRSFLKSYLQRRGVKPEDCDDLLQETFLRCWNILQAEPDADHRRLLVTVARNLHIDFYRRNKKYVRGLEMEFFESIPEDRETRRRRMQRALVESLVENMREQPESRFFKMHYESGYKIQEIAQLTRTSKGTVSSQIFRFRHRVQLALSEQLDAVDERLA